MPGDDLDLAHRLADAAGGVIRSYFRKPHDLSRKDDLSPVTAADRGAERAIRDLLTAERPSDAVFGEEFGSHGGLDGRVWVIDPIDGTRAFVAGKPTFTTLIALWEGDRPLLGVVDQPITGERWVADLTGAMVPPASFNGRPCRTRACDDPLTAVMLSTAPELFDTKAMHDAFLRVQSSVGHFSWGGDAYAYALVAMGAADLVIEAGLKPYDIGPLVPLFEAAGGRFTDWRGDPVTLRGNGMVVATGDARLHERVLALLDWPA